MSLQFTKIESKNNFTNYRTISILPGFRPKHSTNMAVIKLVDKSVNAANNNEKLAGIFVDPSKAFDTIKHDILSAKMAHHGIRGIVLDWFKCSLTKRKSLLNTIVVNLQ